MRVAQAAVIIDANGAEMVCVLHQQLDGRGVCVGQLDCGFEIVRAVIGEAVHRKQLAAFCEAGPEGGAVPGDAGDGVVLAHAEADRPAEVAGLAAPFKAFQEA